MRVREISLWSGFSVNIFRGFVVPLLLSTVITSIGCGGAGTSTSSPPPPLPQSVTVSVPPSNSNVLLGNTQQFTATVTGSSNTAVTWSVNGVMGGNSSVGTISSAGLFTAPKDLPTSASVTVTATSQADTSKSASVFLNVVSDIVVNLATNPAGATSVSVNATLQFIATISGAGHPDPAVTWSVNNVPGGNSTIGTISSSGLYTAPAAVPTPFTITVQAKAVADLSKTATASIIVAGVITSASQTITASQGGTVTLSDGSSVTIPAGALPSDQTVTRSLVLALPQQPPSGLIAGVGPGLILSFSSPFAAAREVFGAESNSVRQTAQANTPSSSANFGFNVNISGNTVSGLQGSAPMADVVDTTGRHNFVAAAGALNAAGSAASFSIPLTLAKIAGSGASSIAVSMANLTPAATSAPPPTGARVWNGSQFVPPSGASVCPNVTSPTGTPGKLLVFVHGTVSSVEQAFPCANQIQMAGNYGQVAGFDYDWPQDINMSGQQLAKYLDQVAQCPGVTQIDVEAHSLGVPVSLSAVTQAQLGTQKLIQNFVSLGGPIMGTPAAAAGAGAASGIQTALQNFRPSSVSPVGPTTLQAILNSPAYVQLTPGSMTLATIRQNVNSAITNGSLNMRTIAVAGVNPGFSPVVFAALSPIFASFGFDSIIGVDSALGLNPNGSPALQNLVQLSPYSHVAREDDLRIAAQLGEILDPSGPFQKTKGAAVSQQPLVN